MSQPRGSFSAGRSSEVERIIAAAEVDTTFAGKKAIRYRGRRSTWPGALALLLVFAGSVFGLVYYGIKVHNNVNTAAASDAAIRERFGTGTVITDGRSLNTTGEDVDVVNPEEYTDKKCEQPNYLSKNGRIVASFTGGKEVQLDIKGVNWMGMQDNKGVPKGLWDASREGSTLYRVGQFLSGNNFNVVRLPLSIDSVMRNLDVDTNLINTNSNRALTATNYNNMISQVVQGLALFNMGVVLDFHVLSALTSDTDALWYGTSIRIDDIKTAITTLATKLCNSKHYNVIGLDLKDGIGKTATWGDGSETDWAAAATTLGNHMLTACPKWVAFIQGVQGDSHFDNFEGDRKIKNKFFAGSDLSDVATAPITLSKTNKVVYAPKYWSSSYLPQPYFFDKGTAKGEMLEDYVESANDTLKKNVVTSMKNMFGPALESGAAVVLSSFGGLMNEADLTAKKTSTRIVEVLIEQMMLTTQGLAGGFWFAFNPETGWPYPAPDNSNYTSAGLVDTTWRAANFDILNTLKKMDSMASIQFIPCTTTA